MSQEWQQSLLNDIRTSLKAQQDVKALALSGSLANKSLVADGWSDIDLTAIVADEAIDRLFSDRSWLESYGDILGLERHDKPGGKLLRVCFAPCRRVDFRLVSDSVLDKEVAHQNAAAGGAYVLLWSKIPIADAFFQGQFQEPIFEGVPERNVAEIVDAFWYKASLATAKIVRNDLLVALHLALDLIRDCLVIQMLLRDKELGTNIHRVGGPGNDILTHLYRQTGGSYPLEILKLVKHSTRLFDDLAPQLLPSYTARVELFLPALEQAETQCRT